MLFRSQMFLIELAQDMDAMSEKILIANELIDSNGSCCTIGVICKARGIDVAEIDYDDPHSVASRVGIAHQMVSEIENENDDWRKETPEERWIRMRKWVDSNIKKDNK